MAKNYAEFKDSYVLNTFMASDPITMIKKNACLVEKVYGAKALAEDIYANAVEVENQMKAIINAQDNKEAYPYFLDESDVLELQDAFSSIRNVEVKMLDKLAKAGIEPRDSWIRDDLSEEEYQGKPIDQKIFEASDLLARILIDVDPDGKIVRG